MIQTIDPKIVEDIKLGRASFLDKYGLDKEELYDKITCENIRSIVKDSLQSIRKWKQKEIHMASVSDWLIEMEEDAGRLERSEWVAKHGASRVEIWERANGADNQGELEL
tara:strand:- start:466 stop:795 length:330 start_codon:yes stop_codon:yes gene_type:complete